VSTGADDDGLIVGMIGAPGHARVGTAGLVRPGNVSWSLDWWIGADDRWHVPGREAAVRQSLVDGMPVVRTAMRVPGGDAARSSARADPDPAVRRRRRLSALVPALVVRDVCSRAEGTSVFVDAPRDPVAARPVSCRRAAGCGDTATEATVDGRS
jgi:hypothetical protein